MKGVVNVADYIRREAAVERFAAFAHMGEDNNIPTDTVISDLKHAIPATDVAPVVRCKACANFRQNAHGVCWCNEYGGAITPEDYCSRAVRENEPPAK